VKPGDVYKRTGDGMVQGVQKGDVVVVQYVARHDDWVDVLVPRLGRIVRAPAWPFGRESSLWEKLS